VGDVRLQRQIALASGLMVVVAVGAAGAAGGRAGDALVACGEEPPETAMYSASLGGRDPRRGLSVLACTPESSLARITVRFSEGAEIRLRRRGEAYAFARYWIGPNRDRGGTLQVPANRRAGRFKLRFKANGQTQPAPVTAMLRTGRRPSLVIRGLPADTAELQLSTVGAGTRATRATLCRREMVSYTGTMRVVLASGARARGDASGGFTCAALPPVRCTC
jgi:hypothetical protein